MRKIFCYELRRLLWNRFFLGIALALLFYRHIYNHKIAHIETVQFD